MSSPNAQALQRLSHLDGSLSTFHDQLNDVLYGDEYQRCVPNLQEGDLVWLVDFMDKALDSLDSSSTAFRKCLRELRRVCGTNGMLPTSYRLPSRVLNIGPDPFASGGFGDVYFGTLDGSRVCIKRVRMYAEDGPQNTARKFCRAAVTWKRLTHPNIAPLLGITIAPFQLISDWMPGGDLPEYIKKHPGADRFVLLSDVARGLCYLHSCNVVHGDLKGPNVLVDSSGHARVADFGLATVIQGAPHQFVHGARWAAPEVMDEGKHSKEADIFSFAMVTIEVFTGAVPFGDSPSVTAVLSITQGKRPPRPIHPTFTNDVWELTQRCWDQDPHSRPEASEVLQALLVPELPAWKQLASRTLTAEECVSAITVIFSDRSAVETVGYLSGDDAQAFVDVIDEALDSLPPHIRRRSLRSLYRICGRQALLPTSLTIPLCYDPTDTPWCHGRFADVWRAQYQGREIAAKALRVYLTSDFERIRKRFCKEVVGWKALRHPNVLPLLGVTMTDTRFVMVSEWMANGNIMEFVKANDNADRLGLIGDVTRGLVYMHDQGVVHGGLKGTNILINNSDRACITDFSLLTIVSDQSTVISSWVEGGTIQWMSPELLDPDKFGLKEGRPTKESDCYALGMVIYEVLSGQTPFAPSAVPVVIRKVLEGERPVRPQREEGKLFTDAIWRALELCWKPWPSDRTSAKVVLLGLGGNPPSGVDGDWETDADDQSDSAARDSRLPTAQRDNGLPSQSTWGSSKGSRVGTLSRSARRKLRTIARALCGL